MIVMLFKHAFWPNSQRSTTSIESCELAMCIRPPFSSKVHFCDLGYMHNVFHGTVGGLPALIGLTTSDSAIEFEKISCENDRK